MNTKKYEFVDGDTIEFNGKMLRRIRALRDIPEFNVKAGDLGGYLEKEENLSSSGSCWVSDKAWVFGEALVFDKARVSGKARVFGEARVYGEAWVSGEARVYGEAWVSGEARVSPVLINGLLWSVTITDHHMRIGCQFHEIEAWDKFTDAEIAAMDGRDALRFWKENKDVLMTLARSHEKKAADK